MEKIESFRKQIENLSKEIETINKQHIEIFRTEKCDNWSSMDRLIDRIEGTEERVSELEYRKQKLPNL